MDGSDAVQLADLQALADGLSTDDPEVRRFVASALDYIQALSMRIEDPEQPPDMRSNPPVIDEDHRRRLDQLILSQAEMIDRLQATLDRVRALRDLAQWSAESTGSQPEDAMIKIGDLTRALRPGD